MFVLELSYVKILKDEQEILVWGCFKGQVPAASQSHFLNTLASSISCCLLWQDRQEPTQPPQDSQQPSTFLGLVSGSILLGRELYLGC